MSETEGNFIPQIQSVESSVAEENIISTENKFQIKRETSLLSAVMIVVGTMIGSGIFMTPNGIANVVPSFIYSLVIWALCGIITTLAAICYGELNFLYPSCGGEYAYLTPAYHPCISFSFLLTNFLLIKPVQTAILLIFFIQNILRIKYVDSVDIPYWPTRLLASIMMILIMILNCYSVKLSLQINNVITYSKFVCIGIIVGLGIYCLATKNFIHLKGATDSIDIKAAGISSAIYYGMWSYEGWNEIGYLVEEMKKPEKNIIPGIFISSAIVIVCYILTNLSYLIILGIDGVRSSSSVAIDASSIYLGRWSILVAILVSLSALGSANATFFCGGRIYFDGARNGHFPRFLCALHRKCNTMIVSYVTQTFFSLLFILFSKDIDTLLLYFSNAMWVYYGSTILAVVVIRYRIKPKNQKFKIPLPLPLIMTCISFALVILSFIDTPIETSISFSIVIGCIPLYFIVVLTRKIPAKYTSSSERIYNSFVNTICQSFDLILPPSTENSS